MDNILSRRLIKLFVYGTLRKGKKFSYYMHDSIYKNLYYTQGQLMLSEEGSVYIDNSDLDAVTVGELHLVSFYCLQRINHLESVSFGFPQRYELAVRPVWKLNKRNEYDFSEANIDFAFYYRYKKSPKKIITGDFSHNFDVLEELKKFLIINSSNDLSPEKITDHMRERMSIWQYEN